MKNKIFPEVVLILVLSTTISCNLFKKQIHPNRPDIGLDTTSFKKPSLISIPVEVNLKPAFDFAEGQVPNDAGAPKWNEHFGTAGADDCGHGVSCEYQLHRTPFTFTMSGQTLTTSVNFSYGVNCRFRMPPVCNPLMSAGCSYPRTASGSWSTKIGIDNQWNTEVKTNNNGVQAGDRCKVGPFGGIVDMTDKVLEVFNKAFDNAATNFDKAINNNLNTRQRISDAWQRISQPFPIQNLGWFSLSPDSLKLSTLSLENNTAKLNLYLKANPKILFGEKPQETIKPIPDNSNFVQTNSLNILLPVSTTYKFVEDQLNKNLNLGDGGIRYPATGKKYIKITKIGIYGYGRKVVFKISFSGTKSGYAYLEGTPSYDVLNNILSFPDLQYSLETKSLMIKAIDFIKHDEFVKDLKYRLQISLQNKVTDLKNKVNDALNKKYQDVTLQGDVTNFQILGIYCDQDKNLFTAFLEINGNLAIHIF